MGKVTAGYVLDQTGLGHAFQDVEPVRELHTTYQQVRDQIVHQLKTDLASGDFFKYGEYIGEIGSMFIGIGELKAAVKGTTYGAKLAESIQLASLATKGKIALQVEKWAPKIEKYLTKCDQHLKNLVNKILDTNLPRPVFQETVEVAVYGRFPAGFTLEEGTLRDIYNFYKKYTDDVVRVSDDAGKVADKVGDILRDGSHFDDAGKLKPNVRCQAGEHNYSYQTDELGRISEAYEDNLQLKLHDGRLRHKENTPDKLHDNHAGHIFGDLFGASPESDNLLSQAKDVNLEEYRRLEREWMNAL